MAFYDRANEDCERQKICGVGLSDDIMVSIVYFYSLITITNVNI